MHSTVLNNHLITLMLTNIFLILSVSVLQQTTKNINSGKIQAFESDSDFTSDVQSSGKSWSPISESEEWSEESETLDDKMTSGIKKRKRESEKRKEPEKQTRKVDYQNANNDEVPIKKSKSKSKAGASPSPEAAKERRKILCPMLFCGSKVIHLPRHMRKVHKWTKEAASKVLLKFNIRKRKAPEKSKNTENEKEANDNSTQEKQKDYHRRRRCPMSKCHSIVLRLPAHLQKVHKMCKSSPIYKRAMLTASYVPDQKHSMIRWKEELTKKRKIDAENDAADLGETSNNCMDNISSNESSMSGNENQGEPSHQVSLESPLPDDGQRSIGEQEPVEDLVLHEFENWLQSPDGGKRDKKTAKQHRTQLATIIKVIDETCDIHSLLNIKLVRNIFLNEYVQFKKYEAGTIKSYLMSLRHFVSFLLSDEPGEVYASRCRMSQQ